MDRYELVVGVATYKKPLGNLSKTESDAKAVHDLLKQYGDFEDIQVMTGEVTAKQLKDAIACLEQTGADGVICSRGALGYPFLVSEVDHFLKTGERLPEPTPIEYLQVAKEHLQGLWDYKGIRGIRQSRKHMTWYSRGFAGSAVLRDRLCHIESLQDGMDCLDGAIGEIAKSSLLE